MNKFNSLSDLIEELKTIENAGLEFNHKIATEMMVSSLYFLREMSCITGVPIEHMDTQFIIEQCKESADQE